MKWRTALVAVCVLGLVACNWPKHLTQREQKMVTELTENLKPRCVGRYVIDMPADAPIFGGAKIDGVAVEAKAMTQKDYEAAMDVRSKELNSTKSRFGFQFLYADTVVEGVPRSRFFISQGNPDVLSPATRIVEAYKWDRGYQIKMQIEGSDFTHPDQTDDPIVKQLRHLRVAASHCCPRVTPQQQHPHPPPPPPTANSDPAQTITSKTQ